jgi:argininosuccinate lyase
MTATTLVLDTLAYSKKLKEAGFTEKQAEVQAEALAEVINERVATKRDIDDLRRDMHEMEERLASKLTIRLGGMLVAGISVLCVLNGFLHH